VGCKCQCCGGSQSTLEERASDESANRSLEERVTELEAELQKLRSQD
jgi:cell division protein FtsB